MGKTFEKKTIWNDKETKKNFKKNKIISALQKYRFEYDDFQEDNYEQEDVVRQNW